MKQAFLIVAYAATTAAASADPPRRLDSPPAGIYTAAMFRQALANGSTAPDFILITVIDARTGESRELCTEAPFLEGALQIEYGIPYDAGERRIRKLALAPTDRHYRFSNPKALANLPRHFSPEIPDAVRNRIASISEYDLLDAGFVQTLYASQPRDQYAAYRDAPAHALLERGISCTRGCRVGNLTPHR